MAWQKPQSTGKFKVNFLSMPNEMERLIILMLEIRIRAAIMGRTEYIRATNQARQGVFRSYEDDEYKEEIKKADADFALRKSRCMEREGSLSTEKYNQAVDEHAEAVFLAVWNLYDRIKKTPQKSEESWDD